MPIYDYECTECGRELAIQHSIRDNAHASEKHIKRGGKGEPCDGKLKRNIGKGGSFVLTGSGWTPKHYA